MRQPTRNAEPDVRGYAVTHPAGPWSLPTATGWHQLLLAAAGSLTVETRDGRWVAPGDRAIWVPDGVPHRLRLAGRVRVRVVYLSATRFSDLPQEPGAVTVRPLLRELALEAVARAPLWLDRPQHHALVELLRDELVAAPAVGLERRLPRAAAARALAHAIEADPAAPLDELVRAVHASRRTVERHFAAEAGLTPAAWQRRARLAAAIERLERGDPVSGVALDVGYATPSAFTAAFRRELGAAPRDWLRQGGGGTGETAR